MEIERGRMDGWMEMKMDYAPRPCRMPEADTIG